MPLEASCVQRQGLEGLMHGRLVCGLGDVCMVLGAAVWLFLVVCGLEGKGGDEVETTWRCGFLCARLGVWVWGRLWSDDDSL
ncbi:hypothetical protein BDU57DRAFT_522019 [Ampelomyces quisqualis]|uniref:Transmembrane protein n=1 Tax=Ampelomyces quisqualis TaxID=50730 RepID=A0A6A5QD38_AMPQU|nr:hypothetical protein BDU57DRAFT_522019 [Ampelomyces quisqualis]